MNPFAAKTVDMTICFCYRLTELIIGSAHLPQALRRTPATQCGPLVVRSRAQDVSLGEFVKKKADLPRGAAAAAAAAVGICVGGLLLPATRICSLLHVKAQARIRDPAASAPLPAPAASAGPAPALAPAPAPRPCPSAHAAAAAPPPAHPQLIPQLIHSSSSYYYSCSRPRPRPRPCSSTFCFSSLSCLRHPRPHPASSIQFDGGSDHSKPCTAWPTWPHQKGRCWHGVNRWGEFRQYAHAITCICVDATTIGLTRRLR